MVHTPTVVSSSEANLRTTIENSFVPTIISYCNPSTPQKAETSYLSLVRKKLIDQDIPSNVDEIILSSWRPGTQNQYSSSLRKWFEFCDVRSINIVLLTVPQVLEFLTIIHENGLSYSFVNTAKSALSSILELGTQTCLGQLPIVKRFMKGALYLGCFFFNF